MGVMGFQDALYKQRIAYASERAVEFADISMEMISYYAISASSILRKKGGAMKPLRARCGIRAFYPLIH